MVAMLVTSLAVAVEPAAGQGAAPRERNVVVLELEAPGHAAGVIAAFDLEVVDVLGPHQDRLLVELDAPVRTQAQVESFFDDDRIGRVSAFSAVESVAVAQGTFWAWGLFWAWGDAAADIAEVEASYRIQAQLDATREAVPGDGSGVTVAVIDTGVDAGHWLLRGQSMVPGWDFVDDDQYPFDDRNGLDDDGDGMVDEGHGHGTYVASLIAATAPGVTIMPIRAVDDDGTAEAWVIARAIAHAIANGADVVNLSLGSTVRQRMLKRLIDDYSEVTGTIFVTAAGNTASAAPTYPASEDEPIAVAASDQNGHLATFSARGPWIDAVLPGTGLIGAYPGGHVVTWDGTSASSAVAAGLVARMRATDPSAGLFDIRRDLSSVGRGAG